MKRPPTLSQNSHREHAKSEKASFAPPQRETMGRGVNIGKDPDNTRSLKHIAAWLLGTPAGVMGISKTMMRVAQACQVKPAVTLRIANHRVLTSDLLRRGEIPPILSETNVSWASDRSGPSEQAEHGGEDQKEPITISERQKNIHQRVCHHETGDETGRESPSFLLIAEFHARVATHLVRERVGGRVRSNRGETFDGKT